ncbi:hypothetical protein [Methanolobus sp. WCC4]|uniref:hypothetical protein n=1 Tax=Methanolobus sp. WCC4 TaxID=3125784 RepID=UPI0030F64F36
MVNGAISITADFKSTLLKSIDDSINFANEESNMSSFYILSSKKSEVIRRSLRTLADFTNTEENRFSSYITWGIFQIFETVGKACSKKEFTVVNEKILVEYKSEYVDYLECLKKSIDSESFDAFIQCSITFFYSSYNVSQELVVTDGNT